MRLPDDERGIAAAGQSPASVQTATVALPATVEAVQLARDFVGEHRDHLPPALVADAQLLVSEIVTNAVRHGRPAITMAICVARPRLGIAVADTGEDLPVLPSETPGSDRPDGRGLLIVDALASAWGVTAKSPPPGKAVWFELQAG